MTPEELEAQRLAEEAEAQRLAQEAASYNPIMQPTDLIGQRGQQETGMDTNPLLMAKGLKKLESASEDNYFKAKA